MRPTTVTARRSRADHGRAGTPREGTPSRDETGATRIEHLSASALAQMR
jgi:hypothetical protein